MGNLLFDGKINGAAMSDARRLAEDRMQAAKAQFSVAARAAMTGDPAAPELANAAYRELNEAREMLRGLPLLRAGGRDE
jgi:hypothetical protein